MRRHIEMTPSCLFARQCPSILGIWCRCVDREGRSHPGANQELGAICTAVKVKVWAHQS